MPEPKAPEARLRLKSERVQEEQPQARSTHGEDRRRHCLEVCFADAAAALRFVTAVAALGQIYGLDPAITCAGGRVEVRVPAAAAGSALDSTAARGLEDLFAALAVARGAPRPTERGRPAAGT